MNVTVEFENVKEMEKKLGKLARWGTVDVKELKKANRKVGNIYKSALTGGAIKDAKKDIVIYRDGKKYRTIRPGTLKRSIQNWTPKGDTRGTIFTGPRVSTITFRNVNPDKDGFFAHWVEAGIAGENKYTGRNTGVFEKTLRSVTTSMRSKQAHLYRQQFKKYVGKL